MQYQVRHDSRDLNDRQPFGAVPCGTTIQIFLNIANGVAPADIQLRCWSTSAGELVLAPQSVAEEAAKQRYKFVLNAPAVPGLLWYHFILRCGDSTRWYGAPRDGLGGEGVLYDSVPTDWQVTVYATGAKVPAWYTHGVMYQIFPDRFHRGDHSGQPPPLPPGALYHPRWDDFPFYAKDPQTGNIVAYDFFGGTLAGIIDKLPYLQSLGVSILYLNPIFTSVSNHKYDTGDYKQVDAQFGGDAGFERLRKAAAAAGIRVILDGVFSHTGSDSLYFREAVQSKESPYYSWYRFTNYPDEYECWWGVTTLPNVDEMDPSYREYVITGPDSVIKHWARRGVAGWRLDVADELPGEFVQEMYRELKAANPNAVLIGEVWEDASHKESYGKLREYLWGHELDSVINYPFRAAVLDFLTGAGTAGAAIRRLASLAENYPWPYFYSTMNVLGTHDVPRILTLLGGAPAETDLTKLAQARYRLPDEARRLGLARLRLAAAIQFTSPGVPCVYYGDEAGMEGHSDPQNRRTYPWGGEVAELVAWYRGLSELRRRETALRTGRWIPLAAGEDVLAFGRRSDDGKDALGEPMADAAVVVLVNRCSEPAEISVDIAAVCLGPLVDLLAEPSEANLYVPDEQGLLQLCLAPLSVKILKAGVHAAFLQRSAGILLHPTSLAGPFGVGDLGPAARSFVDWLAAANQKLWQVLPLNPVDQTGSPYQSASAFAGNYLLISPEDLLAEGLLAPADLPAGLPSDRVEYDNAGREKLRLLRAAFAHFNRQTPSAAFRDFCREAADWLEDYALFMALKDAHGGKAWPEWDPGAAKRRPTALKRWRRELADEIAFHRFVQFVFFTQWTRLRSLANANGIRIVGDLPIFVAHDSADVWAAPQLFSLNKFGRPRTKAGVPPDYFSRTGQLWGNPHYRWEVHAKDNFAWWVRRMRWLLGLVDAVRIDHFRGFEAFWEIPARGKTAVGGRWVKGPGPKLFQALRRELGDVPVLAEDLGVITPAVNRLKDAFFFPGMAVLPFSIWREDAGFHLPAVQPNTFFYTGTHDNDTMLGWLQELWRTDRLLYGAVAAYAGKTEKTPPRSLVGPLIGVVLGSEARIAIVPMQDWLGLDSRARMNFPSTCAGNWGWRLTGGELSAALAAKIGRVTRQANRQ